MFVMHVSETARGGIATYLNEVLPFQVRRYGEKNVAVICRSDHLQDIASTPGVKYYSVTPSRFRIITAIKIYFSALKAGYHKKYRVVHIHSFFAGLVMRFFGTSKIAERSVYCPHGWAFERSGSKLVGIAKVCERALSSRSSKTICVSEHEKTAALSNGIPSVNIVNIHNGISDLSDSDLSYNADTGTAIRLVFIGRLDRQKGFDVLLEALDGVARDLIVDVFGDSVLDASRGWDCPSFVHLHGWQSYSRIHPVLMSCDAVVMPSRWEGFSLVALESFRAGKPVIASDIGPLKEIVVDGITGYTFPVNNSSALAAVINSFDRAAGLRMGEECRRLYLSRFTADISEKKLADVYESILD